MAKHTQAHMSQTVDTNAPSELIAMTKRKMEYYMGAKLIEIGVNPKSALFQWSTEKKGNEEILTCSAYWGESKAQQLDQEQSP